MMIEIEIVVDFVGGDVVVVAGVGLVLRPLQLLLVLLLLGDDDLKMNGKSLKNQSQNFNNFNINTNLNKE